MEELLIAARTAGAHLDAVNLRVAADATFLKTAAERRAYLCGMHAAFLTLIDPTYVAKPAPTATPATDAPPPHAISPTLTSMIKQRPVVPVVVENLEDIDTFSPEKNDTEPTASFRLPPQSLLTELLHDSAKPLSAANQFAPTRWLLLCCYEATHGLGCALSNMHKGPTIPHAVRERATTSLFSKLTATGTGSRPRPADSALYAEAAVIHRRARAVAGAAAPSQSLRRWLLAEPTALTPTIRAPAAPAVPTRAPPMMRGGGPAIAPAYPTLHGWTVERRGHERGFLSGSARVLQPTAGEEATQRHIWGC